MNKDSHLIFEAYKKKIVLEKALPENITNTLVNLFVKLHEVDPSLFDKLSNAIDSKDEATIKDIFLSPEVKAEEKKISPQISESTNGTILLESILNNIWSWVKSHAALTGSAILAAIFIAVTAFTGGAGGAIIAPMVANVLPFVLQIAREKLAEFGREAVNTVIDYTRDQLLDYITKLTHGSPGERALAAAIKSDLASNNEAKLNVLKALLKKYEEKKVDSKFLDKNVSLLTKISDNTITPEEFLIFKSEIDKIK